MLNYSCPGGYQLYDEGVSRSGGIVTRRYQFARWIDGSGYLRSSRESRLGDSQLDSGPQFDVLEEREQGPIAAWLLADPVKALVSCTPKATSPAGSKRRS